MRVVLFNVMRSVGTGRLGERGAALCMVLAGAVGLLASGCRAEFVGPYPCADGYASCLQDQNGCETSIRTDGLNCGACGKACPLGATCVNAACGARVPELASLMPGSQSAIAVNSTGVFWTEGGNIYSAPLSGGAPTTVANDAYTCGPSVSFALDDNALYYWAAGSNCPQPGNCGGLTKLSLLDGTSTVLVANQPAGNTASLNQCGSIAVDAENVYVLTTQQQGSVSTRAVYKTPLTGGAPMLLATAQGGGGSQGDALALTPTHLVFEVWMSNGPPSFEVVPLGGAPAFSIALPPYSNGGGAFAADADNIYVVGSGCPCGNNSSSGPPGGGVSKIAIGGGGGELLAQFSGQAGGIAADATTVYWSTDTTLWKVSKTGGSPIEAAGNLSGGVRGLQCNGCGGGASASSTPISIALDATSIYLADHGTVNAVLKVTK